MLDGDWIIIPKGFLWRKHITGAEETRNMQSFVWEVAFWKNTWFDKE
jgi:hypothetical protein